MNSEIRKTILDILSADNERTIKKIRVEKSEELNIEEIKRE